MSELGSLRVTGLALALALAPAGFDAGAGDFHPCRIGYPLSSKDTGGEPLAGEPLVAKTAGDVLPVIRVGWPVEALDDCCIAGALLFFGEMRKNFGYPSSSRETSEDTLFNRPFAEELATGEFPRNLGKPCSSTEISELILFNRRGARASSML